MIIDNTEYLIDSIEIINLLRADLALHDIEYIIAEPRESGDNIQIQCPYHGNGQERRPSAGIRKSDGLLHCFACGATHPLPEVISYCFGRDDCGRYGKLWLDEHIADKHYIFNFGSKYDDATLLKKLKNRVTKEEAYKRHNYNVIGDLYDNNDWYVSEKELDEYRYTHPYWAKRGITEDWVIELFDLGYDLKTHMITFPVRDIQGRCEYVAKRSVKTKFFQYPKNIQKGVYGIYELYQMLFSGENIRKIYVCESMIDCILLWQSGHYAVALNGLGTDRQFRQLRNMDIQMIVLATDNDDAGKNARKRIRQNVNNKLLLDINFPDGIKDIGECTKEQIDHIEDWEKWGIR